MRITYFTNAYPAISQTFIRRELQGLEKRQYQIQRVALRTRDSLVDELDVKEASITTKLFLMPKWRFCALGLSWLLRRPVRTTTTFLFGLRAIGRQGISTFKMMAYLLEAMVLAEVCKKHRSRLVRVHFGTNGAMVCRLAKRMGGPDYSVAFHGPDEFDAAAKWDIGGLVEESAFVTAISSFCRSQIFRWTRVSAWDRVHIIRCGIDLDYFYPSVRDFGVKRKLCVVCRLAPQKGLPILVSSFARAISQGADLTLDIVGDGELRGLLESEISSLGIIDRVKFHGSLDGAGVREVMQHSHAFVMPSFAEGLPVVIMEAMAVGLPVITTAIAGIPELVVPGETGWLAPAGDEKAMEDCLKEFAASDASTLQKMSIAARARIVASHDIELEVEKLDQVIRRWVQTG